MESKRRFALLTFVNQLNRDPHNLLVGEPFLAGGKLHYRFTHRNGDQNNFAWQKLKTFKGTYDSFAVEETSDDVIEVTI